MFSRLKSLLAGGPPSPVLPLPSWEQEQRELWLKLNHEFALHRQMERLAELGGPSPSQGLMSDLAKVSHKHGGSRWTTDPRPSNPTRHRASRSSLS